MSTTTNVQSYLPYVFRPVYTWNSNTGVFSTTFNLSNIDTMTVNTARFNVVYIGDSSNNLYLGSNAGLAACNAVSNTAVGVAAAASVSNASNSEFIGFQAGSAGKVISNSVVVGAYAGTSNSNVVNSILIGTSNSAALSNISSTISIGGNAGGTGTSNIFIGTSNGIGMTGSSNVLIGHGVNLASIPPYTLADGITTGPSFSTASNLFMVGSANKILIAGNFSNGVVSIGSTNTNANVCNIANIRDTIPNLSLDVYNVMRVQNGLAIGCDPNSGFTLDSVGSFRAQNGYGQIYLSNYYDPVNGVPAGDSFMSGAVVNMSTTGGSSMTLDVKGTARASNVIVSNQVSAGGYYSVQSGTTGVSLGAAATTTIPITKNGIVFVSVYNSAGAPLCYNGVWMANHITAPIAVLVSSNTTLTYTVTLSSTTITILNTSGNTFSVYYNVTFFPIG